MKTVVEEKTGRWNRIFELLLVLAVLMAALFVRTWKLADVPAGFYIDEASFGYNAYSILKTGADEFGNRYPLYTPSFGTGKNPVYLYATVLSTAVFGLNEFSTRLPAALFGVLTVLFSILLCIEITKKKYASIAAGLFLALNPWHIFFSRFAIETTSLTCFTTAGFFLLLRGLKKPSLLPLASMVLGIGFYTYAPAIPFITIMLVGTFFIFKTNISSITTNTKVVFVAILIVSTIPHVVHDIRGSEQVSHFKTSFVFNEANDGNSRELLRKSSWPANLFYKASPAVMRTAVFAKNYISNYSPVYLFKNGDMSTYRAHVRGYGPFLPIVTPLLLLGLFAAAISFKKPGIKFLLLWIFSFPIGAAISTQTFPSATRTFTALPGFQILFAVGLVFAVDTIEKYLKNRSPQVRKPVFCVTASLLLVLYILNFSAFFYLYIKDYPTYSSLEWNNGFRDAIQYAESHSDLYDDLAVTENIPFSYIYVLYYSKFPPEELQRKPLKWNGPYRVGRIGKYDIRDAYLQYKDKKQLFITGSWQRPDLEEIPVQSRKRIPSFVKVSEFIPYGMKK